MEVPEEEFETVCQELGFPKAGENIFVEVTKLYTKPKQETKESVVITKAVMICKNEAFQHYCHEMCGAQEVSESHAILTLYEKCGISSRSELTDNAKAIQKFGMLVKSFNAWKQVG
jgi:hypothetical protein